jgi:WD40 repeat protein
LVAGGGFAKDIKVWDVQTGKLLRTLVGHSHMVRAIAFAPRGHLLASGGDDQALRIWDALRGDLKRTISPVPAGVQSVAVSPDGKSIVSVSSKWLGTSARIEGDWTGEVDLWDAQTGTLQWQHKLDDPMFSVAFSPDGRTIASSGFHVRIWETETGVLKRTLKPERGGVYALAFSPDGKILVGGDRFYVRAGDGTVGLSEVYFWNMLTGELERTLTELSPWLRAVALSPDGSVLATGTSGPTKTSPDRIRSWVVSEIKLWDVRTGQLLRTLEGESGDIMSLAFSPDGRTIVYADNQTVKLLEAATGKDKETLMIKP